MRAGNVVNVTPADRRRLEAIVADRCAPQKHVWRAQIILATADGCGTAEIMRRSGKAKPNVLDGTIISRNMNRHRHQEVIRFLNDIDARVPKRTAIHAIVDNYATHKHAKVRRWLAQ